MPGTTSTIRDSRSETFFMVSLLRVDWEAVAAGVRYPVTVLVSAPLQFVEPSAALAVRLLPFAEISTGERLGTDSRTVLRHDMYLLSFVVGSAATSFLRR